VTLRTVGVEEELLLIDGGNSRPAAVGPEVVEAAAGSDRPLEHELKQEQVEIGSRPSTSIPAILAELRELRSAAARAAQARGATIAAVATSPWKVEPQTTPDDRYARMTERFGLLARQQLTCGQHVHVAVASRNEGVAVLDRIRGWLPVLTAISANSPFWQGQDTDYASFRSVLWGRWPTAGPTDPFGDEAGYDQAVRELIASGAAMDDGMIYFDARLSARYPTIEIRVADVCTDVEDAVLIAALARALVDTAGADWVSGKRTPAIRTALLRAASWRAARSGLSGELIDPRSGAPIPAWTLLEDLLQLLAAALERSGDEGLIRGGFTRCANTAPARTASGWHSSGGRVWTMSYQTPADGRSRAEFCASSLDYDGRRPRPPPSGVRL